MLFQFGAHSALLLPFVVPGLLLALHLLVRVARFGHLPDGLLGLLLLLNVLPVAQWMLGYAGWYDSHDGYSTCMFYVPWQPWLMWGRRFTCTSAVLLTRSLSCGGIGGTCCQGCCLWACMRWLRSTIWFGAGLYTGRR